MNEKIIILIIINQRPPNGSRFGIKIVVAIAVIISVLLSSSSPTSSQPQHHHHRHHHHRTFCSLRFCTVEQVTLADNNGHMSARFCVMRRKQRRFLDLSMRVTVYNPLTASSYWRVAAVLTEMRHDAALGLPGTQKRVAVDAPPCPTHKFNGAWGLSWGFRRGAYESNRSAGVSLLFSSRWYRQGHLRRVCCPPLPLSGRCHAAVKKWSRTLLFHCSLFAS